MAGSLRAWLSALELEHLTPVFEENEIGIRDLPLLDEGDLRELGLPLGPRRRVLNAIADLRSVAVAPAAEKPKSEHPSHSEAERRQLTVMFCDLVGSTGLSAGLDRSVITTSFYPRSPLLDRSAQGVGGHRDDDADIDDTDYAGDHAGHLAPGRRGGDVAIAHRQAGDQDEVQSLSERLALGEDDGDHAGQQAQAQQYEQNAAHQVQRMQEMVKES